MKKIMDFLSSKTNESIKRLIAFLFCISLIVVLFIPNSETIKIQIIYGMFVLIALLLGLATAETIVGIFKNKNN